MFEMSKTDRTVFNANAEDVGAEHQGPVEAVRLTLAFPDAWG